MSRNKSSHINFSIDISGVEDARELAELMPKIVEQFNKVAEAADRAERAQKGGRNLTDAQKVREKIVMMSVNTINKEITTLKELGAAYGSVINQINALERAGKPVAKLREQALKQHNSLRQRILEQERAESKLTQSQQQLKSSSQQLTQAQKQQIVAGRQLKTVSQQGGKAITQQAQYMRNASYVWLNAGYIIQDSPYGIRGIANNISQLTIAWQLLNQRLIETAASTGVQVTAFQALKKTMFGPTGVVLLLGSLLPSALVLLDRHWDEIIGNVNEASGAIKEYGGLLQESIELMRRLATPLGEDPFGFNEMLTDRENIADMKEELVGLLEIRGAISRGESLGQISTTGFSFGDVDWAAESKRLNEARDSLKEVEEELGALKDIDISILTKQINELTDEIVLAEAFLARDPLASLEASISKSTDALVNSIQLYTDEAAPEHFIEGAKEHARLYLKYLESEFVRNLSERNMPMATVIKKQMDRLRDELEEKNKDKEKELDPLEFQYDARKDAMTSLIELRLQASRKQEEIAFTTSAKIVQIERQRMMELRLIDREEFDNYYEYTKEKEAINNEYDQKVKELRTSQYIFEIEMQNRLLEHGLDNPTDYQKTLSDIETFYTNRESIIRASVQTENELQEELHKNNMARRKAEEEAERQLNDRKLSIFQNYAKGTVFVAQALGNVMDQSAKAQFQIQKIASASTAIINARVAYTKTLAQGGFFAKPLAISAMALGLAQAAAIMSQSYDSASSTGPGAQFGGLTSYRGFDFEQTGGFNQTYQGSTSVNSSGSFSNQMFPEKIKAEFTDGFGKVVAEGNIQLDRQNKGKLGYWQ